MEKEKLSYQDIKEGKGLSPYERMITGDRIFLTGTIDQKMVDDVSKQLIPKIEHQLQLEKPKEHTVYLSIDSDGGDTDATMRLVDTMVALNNLKSLGLKIATFSTQRCESAAVLIAAAGAPGMRYANSDTRFLIHPQKFNLNDKFTLTQIGAIAERGFKKQQKWNDRFTALTKITSEQMEGKFNSDYWTKEPQEAVELGIVDQIIETAPPKK
jgi:ATP-dependent Clp protease protease subunit